MWLQLLIGEKKLNQSEDSQKSCQTWEASRYQLGFLNVIPPKRSAKRVSF